MSGGTFVERERLGSIAAVEDMLATAAAAYQAALTHDGLPPETRFAVFSPDNPVLSVVDRAVQQFWEMAATCAVHGYVGLTTRSRDVYTRRTRRAR